MPQKRLRGEGGEAEIDDLMDLVSVQAMVPNCSTSTRTAPTPINREGLVAWQAGREAEINDVVHPLPDIATLDDMESGLAQAGAALAESR